MKKNKEIYIVIGLLSALLLAIIVLICVILAKGKNNVPDVGMTGEIFKEDNGDGLPGKVNTDKKVLEQVSEETKGKKLVTQGFAFEIPSEFGVMFPANMDEPAVFMQDVFQLRIVMREESDAVFESYYDDPSVLTQKAIAAGGNMVEDCMLDEIDGLEVFDFCVQLEEDLCFVFRTRVSDGYSFCGNMVLQDETLTKQDCLNVVALLAKSAVKTDEPDTEPAEFLGEIDYSDRYRSESTLDAGDFQVTYKVPAAFYYGSGNGEEEDEIREYYMTEVYDTADVIILEYEGGAQAYVRDHYTYEGDKSMTLHGRTFYYNERIQDGEYYDQRIIAAADIRENWIYVLDIENGREFSFDELDAFFDFVVK